MTSRIRIPFSAVPLGEPFYDYDEWCIKTSETTARDNWCAPGFEFGMCQEAIVSIDPRKLEVTA